jgi:PPOX class probable F420-dependent enzyme
MSLIPASHRDLADHGIGFLSTIGPDGFPQVTAVGFLVDDDTVLITASDARQKVKNLRRNPQCTFFVADPANPHRTLELRGVAELIPDGEYTWAARIAGANGATVEQVKARDLPGELRHCIAVRPAKVNAWPPTPAS